MEALALSGGGSHGAYTVGALKYWISSKNLHFPLITGTSTGALIAPMAALGAIDTLVSLYTSVHTEDIYKFRPVTDLLKTTSLTDTQPLWNLINKFLPNDLAKQVLELGMKPPEQRVVVALSAYRVQDASVVYFHTGPADLQLSAPRDKTSLFPIRSAKDPLDCLRRAMLVSSNQPVIMPALCCPQEEQVQQYVDGGVRDGLPGAVCKFLGADSLRGIMLSPPPAANLSKAEKYTDIFHLGSRVLSCMIGDSMERSLKESYVAFGQEKVKILRPAQPFDGHDSNTFFPSDMNNWLNQGYREAYRMGV